MLELVSFILSARGFGQPPGSLIIVELCWPTTYVTWCLIGMSFELLASNLNLVNIFFYVFHMLLMYNNMYSGSNKWFKLYQQICCQKYILLVLEGIHAFKYVCVPYRFPSKELILSEGCASSYVRPYTQLH